MAGYIGNKAVGLNVTTGDILGDVGVGGVVTANAGVVVDNFTLDGTTLALSSGNFTLDVAGDIIFDGDGADILFKDGGTEWLGFNSGGTMSAAGAFTLDANGDIVLDSNNGIINIKDGGTEFLRITEASGNATIESKVSDKDFTIKVNDGGTSTVALQLNGEVAGTMFLGAAGGNGTAIIQGSSGAGGTNQPGTDLVLKGGVGGGTGGSSVQIFTAPGGNSGTSASNAVKRATIDSAGRVLVGIAAARDDFYQNGVNPHLQVEGSTTATSSISATQNAASADGPRMFLGKTRGTGAQVVSNGDRLGAISMQGADGSDLVPAAEIHGFVNGTPGANQMPGRLMFATTAAGAQAVTERMQIDALGVVSIKHTGSTANFVTQTDSSFVLGSGSGNHAMTIFTGTANIGSIFFADGNAADSRTFRGGLQYLHNSDQLRFFTGGTTNTPFIIDSSGNVIVGKTATAIGTVGAVIGAAGFATITRDDSTPLNLNRKSEFGELIALYKDGTQGGIIGVNANDPFIARPNGNGLRFFNTGLVPCDAAGDNADNVMSLGIGAARFDDAFITNGVTTGSDRTEKQDIAALTSTEMLVAARISKTFHTYRWKDAVVAKGDDARIHTGTIAQEVQAAFTAESLDAGNYAMFMSGTWWEHDVDVAAVEADDTVEPAIEAKDAYTRTDTYDTEDEAPSGSTSRTRLGIRYPELLSFLAAYNEQRFAAIETRLTALEG